MNPSRNKLPLASCQVSYSTPGSELPPSSLSTHTFLFNGYMYVSDTMSSADCAWFLQSNLSKSSGFGEARGLLRDWLANFISGLAENLTAESGGERGGAPTQEELAEELRENPLVVGVARQVFGLLQSPVLHPTKGIADARYVRQETEVALWSMGRWCCYVPPFLLGFSRTLR